MIGASPSVKVFAYTEPVDMRKRFDGLFGLVKTHLGRDPLFGDLFVFVSRNRKRAKVLLWDGTGLCLYAKRLERGQFANLWSGAGKTEIELTAAELQLFMEGSLLVGKGLVSPRKLCLNCLIKRGLLRQSSMSKVTEIHDQNTLQEVASHLEKPSSVSTKRSPSSVWRMPVFVAKM